MKPLLLLLLLFPLVVVPQDVPTETSDVVVLKFRCGKYETGTGMIHSAQEPDSGGNEPISINQTSRNESQTARNNRDLQDRRAEMAISEMNAKLSTKKSAPVYFYRIQVQNAGTKVVKGIAWEYQPSEEPDPSNRQFYCVINAKPNEKREFELFSPYAPSRVVDASKPEDKPNAEKKDKIIVNKIEYMDGTFWKRTGWNLSTFSVEDTSKVGGGKCIGI
jgi:hypothetical protein